MGLFFAYGDVHAVPTPSCPSGERYNPTTDTCEPIYASGITALQCTLDPSLAECADAQLTGTDQLQELDQTQIDSLGAQLYCNIYDLMNQNVGLLIGFALSAWGFWNIITNGFAMGSLIMILAGVFFTAIPGVFEKVLNDGATFVDQNSLGDAADGFDISRGHAACP